MSIQIRRGTNADRALITPAEGELIYTTDSKVLYVGDGSTLGGNQVSTAGVLLGTLSGDIGLNNFNITGTGLEINGSNGAITATSFTGSINGSLGSNLTTGTRSITNGSNLTINGSNGAITASSVTASSVTANTLTGEDLSINNFTNSTLSISDNVISIGTTVNASGLNIISEERSILSIFSSKPVTGFPEIMLYTHSGTNTAPTNTIAGQWLHSLKFNGYYGSNYKIGPIIRAGWAESATLTNSLPGSRIEVITGNNNSGFSVFSFDEKGVFSSPVIKAGSFITSSLPESPVAGYIVFDSTTSQFKGWNGTSWVVLG